MAIEIKDSNFEELLASGKPVVVDFWATWCGPCKKIAPDVEALAEAYKEQVIIGKCDVDANDELTGKYGVRNIPTILFIKNGEVVDKQVGAATKAQLEEKVKKLLS
ncbi:thioredoxin [Phocaeicola sp.]